MKHSLLLLVALTTWLPLPVTHAEETLIPTSKTNLSLRNEVGHAIERGLAWLTTQQKETGYWSVEEHPAMTAMVLTAFLREPSGSQEKKKSPAVVKGYEWLLTGIQPDGGIYRKDLRNYNTSVSLLALHLANDPKYAEAIANARKFVVGLQAKGLTDASLDGGIGYGPGATNREHPDLSNTLLALEALKATKELESGENVDPAQKLNWKAAIEFVSRCQNLTATNSEPWASDDPANKGGFIYFPGHSMAGEMDLPNGKKALRSYGSMSYAGLMSFIYADLQHDDPRVLAVMDWLRANYTLDENPGMGADGLFYYYQVLAKGLSASGTREIVLADGTKKDWRTDLAKKLLNLQNADGSWINTSGRWWEKDPVLVTTYSLLSLEAIYRAL